MQFRNTNQETQSERESNTELGHTHNYGGEKNAGLLNQDYPTTPRSALLHRDLEAIERNHHAQKINWHKLR